MRRTEIEVDSPSGWSSVEDLDLRYLETELAQIDALIQREVRRWQLAGQDLSDAYRGMYVSDADAEGLLGKPFATNWGQMVELGRDETRKFTASQARAKRESERVKKLAIRRGHELRLERLARVFELDRFDLDVFLICLAPTLDLRYERLYGYLQDDVTRKLPSINLVLDLLSEPGPGRLRLLSRFDSDASLIKFNLLEQEPAIRSDLSSPLCRLLRPDQAVVAWLLGNYQPHPELGASIKLSWVEESEMDRLLVGESMEPSLSQFQGQNIIACWGPDQARQEAAVRLIATRGKRPLLIVNLKGAMAGDVEPLRILRLVLRDGRLTGAVPCITDWDACLEEGAPPPSLLVELFAHPGTVIVSGREAWQPKGIDRDRNLVWLEFSIPAYSQRKAIWEDYLGEIARIRAFDLSHLAGQFSLTAGQTRDAVATAKDRAVQRGDSLRMDDLFAAARSHSNPRLAGLARKIDPRFDWGDIVLPEDRITLLQEIVNTVRGRPQVLEEWGVGVKLASSSGVTILFAGEPGTGKTMAAEIIAGELGLDLYKIDLSSVVSKYIGETEKNLERIFDEAAMSNAILFFDEADALFGKRSEVKDAHDRYANIEISYLLQRMEAYDGVTILATNLRANLDEAFTRRLQFAVDFPFPEEEDRLRIWHTLFPTTVPHDPEIDFPMLAQRFKLAGGNIRNVIVNAAYLAAADGKRVTMSHLLHGTRRELQKMRRLISEADFTDGYQEVRP